MLTETSAAQCQPNERIVTAYVKNRVMNVRCFCVSPPRLLESLVSAQNLLVVLLIISETVDASLIGDDKSLTGGLISAATLVLLVQLVGYLSWRSKPIGRWVEGRPKILVRNGQVCDQTLDQQQITRSELIEALRKEGSASLTGLRFAVLENDGSISVGKQEQS